MSDWIRIWPRKRGKGPPQNVIGLHEEVQFNRILDRYPKGILNRSAQSDLFSSTFVARKEKDENEVYYDTSDELSEHVRHSTPVPTSRRGKAKSGMIVILV